MVDFMDLIADFIADVSAWGAYMQQWFLRSLNTFAAVGVCLLPGWEHTETLEMLLWRDSLRQKHSRCCTLKQQHLRSCNGGIHLNKKNWTVARSNRNVWEVAIKGSTQTETFEMLHKLKHWRRWVVLFLQAKLWNSTTPNARKESQQP